MSVSTTLKIASIRASISMSRSFDCPACGRILDAANAGKVTIRLDGVMRFNRVFCGPCVDEHWGPDAASDIAKRAGVEPSSVEIEIIDGRSFSDDEHAIADALLR